MKHESTIIIKTLDNTPRLLFWKIDSFALVTIPFLIGSLFGSFLVMSQGVFIYLLYRRFKRRYPGLNIKHLAYWSLPTGKKVLFPPSHKREYTL